MAGSSADLMRCDIIIYCTHNDFKRSTKTSCGHIQSNEEEFYTQWRITQDASSLLKWNMVEFMVVKNDVHYSKSHLVWIEQREKSYYCGFHLPWEKYSQGDVAIT